MLIMMSRNIRDKQYHAENAMSRPTCATGFAVEFPRAQETTGTTMAPATSEDPAETRTKRMGLIMRNFWEYFVECFCCLNSEFYCKAWVISSCFWGVQTLLFMRVDAWFCQPLWLVPWVNDFCIASCFHQSSHTYGMGIINCHTWMCDPIPKTLYSPRNDRWPVAAANGCRRPSPLLRKWWLQ